MILFCFVSVFPFIYIRKEREYGKCLRTVKLYILLSFHFIGNGNCLIWVSIVYTVEKSKSCVFVEEHFWGICDITDNCTTPWDSC